MTTISKCHTSMKGLALMLEIKEDYNIIIFYVSNRVGKSRHDKVLFMHTEGVEYKEILNISKTSAIKKDPRQKGKNLQLVEIRVRFVKLGGCGIRCSKIGFGFELVIMAITFPLLFSVVLYVLGLSIQNLELWNTSNSTAIFLMFSSSLFNVLLSCFP